MDIKFESIEKANKEIRTIDVKGKQYAEVTQRVKAFRKVFPNGSITTELVSYAENEVIFKAVVKDGENILATGYSSEVKGDGFINKTSFIENAETSAVGRALGFIGFGIDCAIASAEELKSAQALPTGQTPAAPKAPTQTQTPAQAQTEVKSASDTQKKKIASLCKELGREVTEFYTSNKLSEDTLSSDNAAKAIKFLEGQIAKANGAPSEA